MMKLAVPRGFVVVTVPGVVHLVPTVVGVDFALPNARAGACNLLNLPFPRAGHR